MQKKKIPYQLICLFLFAIITSSCKKEKSPVVFSAVSSGTELNLYSVRQLNDDTLLACGGKDGSGILLRSADSGNSWSILNNSFDQVIYDIYFINDHLGFAAGGMADVFKTVDGGNNWEKLYLPFPLTGFPPNFRVPLRKIFFVNDSLGFICGGGKFEAGIIFKTTDQGLNWTLLTFNNELRGILFLNDQAGFACGFGIMLKTTDSGINWNVMDSPNEFYTSLENSSGELWTSGYNGGVYKSPSAGSDWQPVNKSNNGFSSRSHFNCIRVAPGGTIVASGNDGIISISNDDGNSWNEGESFNRTTIKCFLLLDKSTGIALGTHGMIFKFSF
ncbi:MAG TPA: YCF48-related protein [Bacteroidia bacterium]|nr:YCF48-related protein [Bacteroidia bacterium]